MSETLLSTNSVDTSTPPPPPPPPTETAETEQADDAVDSSDVILINDSIDSVLSPPPRRRRRRNDVIDLTCLDATADDDRRHTLDLIDLTQSPLDSMPPSSARRVRRTRASGRPQMPLPSEQRQSAVASQPPIRISNSPQTVAPDPPTLTAGPPTVTVDPNDWMKCPVCMCTYTEVKRAGHFVQSTLCGHLFCSHCLSNSLKRKKECPTCRKKVNAKAIHRVYVT